MTLDHDFDDLLRSFLADEGRRIEATAPPIEHAVRQVAPRLAAGQRPPLDRRLTMMLVAALLLATLVISLLAVGRELLPVPPVREPDGSVVFVNTNQIRIRALDSSQSGISVTGIGHIRYMAPSPDGTRMAFQTSETSPGETRMWLTDADGPPVSIGDVELQRWQLDWNADGTRIAFLAGERRLAVVDADAPFARRDLELPSELSADEAVWHPDGNEVFVRDRATMAVHAVDVDSGSTRLVHSPTDEVRGPGADTMWISDDGRHLAIFLQRVARVVALDTGEVTTWSPGGVMSAGALSPDGEWLGAVIEDSLVIATGDGRLVHDIAFEPGGATSTPSLAFAPDSDRLLLVPGGQDRALLVEVVTGTVEQILWDLDGGQMIRWLPGD
jgi:hypothetical protein